jgi:DNA-binding transcriptional ArsR family regulator
MAACDKSATEVSKVASVPVNPRPLALPEWCQKDSADFIKWTPIPNTFFESAMRKLTGLESQVLGLIARFTYGDDRANRPEWATVSLTKFATYCGASKNGVALALDRLERAGAIKAERVGRDKRYRVAIQELDKLKDLPPAEGESVEVEEDEETGDETSAVRVKADDVPTIRIGKHSLPLSAVKFCKDCADKVIDAVKAAMEPAGAASADKANETRTIVPVTGTIEPPVSMEAAQKANKGRMIVPLSGTIEASDAEDATNLATLESHLSKLFAKKLGEAPPRRLTAPALAELRAAGVPIGDLLSRIDARRGVFHSYAFLANLVADVINAHAAANREAQQQQQPQQQLSPAERIRSHAAARIAEVEAHAPDTPDRAKVIEALEHVNANASKLAKDPGKLRSILEDAETVLASCVWNQLKEATMRMVNSKPAAVRSSAAVVSAGIRSLILEGVF